MKKIFSILTIIIFSSPLFAQVPNTDIWLLDITTTKDSVILSNPLNITNRAGYDNQPAFSPDGTYILYTSVRDDDQSDIYKYDLKTKTITQFTKTKTSEYSPTFMPDRKNISVVMVEPDSTQRLWKFPISGGDPACIMKNIDSIGYHCWINKDSLALVMITEPPTLQTANVTTQQTRIIASNVSRCIEPNTNQHGFYYLKKNTGNDSTWLFNDTYKIRKNNLNLPSTSQDYYFFSKKDKPSIIVYGCTAIIYVVSAKTGDLICKYDCSSSGIINITRITMSKDGKKLAIAAESKK